MTTPEDSIEPAPATPRSALQTRGGILLAVGGIIAFVASFLTWASVKSGPLHADVKGTDGGKDGNLTLVLGLVILALAAWRLSRDTVPPWAMILAGLCAMVVLIIAIYDQSSLRGSTVSPRVHVSSGLGLYLEELAGLLAIGGTVSALRFERVKD